MFREHYFLKCYLKYYDPCLNSVYAARDDAIRMNLPPTDIIVGGVLLPATTADTYLVFNGDEVVPGWQRGTWMIVRDVDVLKYVTEKEGAVDHIEEVEDGEVGRESPSEVTRAVQKRR